MTDYINLCERENLCNLFISQKELAAYEIKQMRAISARYILRVSFRNLCATLVQQSDRGSTISCNKNRHTSNLHRISHSLMLCYRSVVMQCLRLLARNEAWKCSDGFWESDMTSVQSTKQPFVCCSLTCWHCLLLFLFVSFFCRLKFLCMLHEIYIALDVKF